MREGKATFSFLIIGIICLDVHLLSHHFSFLGGTDQVIGFRIEIINGFRTAGADDLQFEGVYGANRFLAQQFNCISF